jgi:hypothetical protein
MSAYADPAPTGPPPRTSSSVADYFPAPGEWVRLLGGLLFAAGAVALAFRKGDSWSEWAVFVVFLIATGVLYAVAESERPALGVAPERWQSAFYVFAILLLPITLLVLVSAIDDDADGPLNTIWIFGLSAAVAALTALRRGAWWQMLVAGIYAVIAWIALWDKILDGLSGNQTRWLLIAAAAILLVAAVALAREARPQAADLITAAGLAAIVAGAVGLAGLSSQLGSLGGLGADAPKHTQFWNFYLLVVSLLLIAYSTRAATRGPGYIGAIGFTAFIVLVGVNVIGRLKGDEFDKVVGWPLALLIIGGGLLIASFVMPRTGTGGGRAQPPPPPPGAVPPGQGGGLLDQWRTQSPPPPGPGQQPPPQ